MRQFLSHRLWDVGNTGPYGHRGDLTTMTEAIHFHGGEARASRDAFFALPADDQAAIIEFLKTLQILPDGSPPMVDETLAATLGRPQRARLRSSRRSSATRRACPRPGLAASSSRSLSVLSPSRV